MEEDQTREHDDQRAAHQEVLGGQITQQQRPDPCEEHREPDPAPSGRQRRQLLAALPDEESAEDGHEEAMRVVGVVPPLPRQIAEDATVDANQQPQDDEDYEACPESWAPSSVYRVKIVTVTP